MCRSPRPMTQGGVRERPFDPRRAPSPRSRLQRWRPRRLYGSRPRWRPKRIVYLPGIVSAAFSQRQA